MTNRKGNKTETTREILLDIFIHNRDWNAPQIWEKYKERFNDPANEVRLSDVQKHVHALREEYKYIGHLDAPWHLGLLMDSEFMKIYPQFNINMTAEAIRVIVDIQKKLEKDTDKNNQIVFDPVYGQMTAPNIPKLTIRQALWISRLYKLFDKPKTVKHVELGESTTEVLDQIYHYACAYAEHEIICKLNKTYFDTFLLDQAIRLGNLVYSQENRHTITFYDGDDFEAYGLETADPELKKFGDIRKIKWDFDVVDINGKIVQPNVQKEDKTTKKKALGKSKNKPENTTK